MIVVTQQPCDEGVIRGRPSLKPCTKSAGRWILAATILASSMVFIDGTVINVALPALQASLDATVVDVQWVIESYSLLLAALLLVGGSLGDHYGRRRIFLIGVMVFVSRLGLVRLCREHQSSDYRADTARARRCFAGAGKSRHYQRLVSRARARSGDRNLVGFHCHYRGGRSRSWRLANRTHFMARDFFYQSSARIRCLDHLAPIRSGEPRRKRNR